MVHNFIAFFQPRDCKSSAKSYIQYFGRFSMLSESVCIHCSTKKSKPKDPAKRHQLFKKRFGWSNDRTTVEYTSRMYVPM